MSSEAERMARAGEYVLGRMNVAERERAELDLERDAEFRSAVMAVAERMRRFNGNGRGAEAAEEAWSGIARRLEALPHMRGARPAEAMPEAVALSFPEEEDMEGGLSGLIRAVRAKLNGLRRLTRRRKSRVAAVALLRDEAEEVAAMLEVRGDGALRLLLLQNAGLAAGERLSLWGMGEDVVYRRLSAVSPSPDIVLKGIANASRYAGFALVRERVSAIPPSHTGGGQFFASGPARSLAQAPNGLPNETPRRRAQILTLNR